METLANDEPLMDAGLDSLAAVEFANAISKAFRATGETGGDDLATHSNLLEISKDDFSHARARSSWKSCHD